MNDKRDIAKKLLSQKELSKEDEKYFVKSPYYRNLNGLLFGDYSSVRDQWSNRIIGENIEFLEEKNHLIYYKMKINNLEAIYGKIVYENDRIRYLYETRMLNDKTRYFCVISYDGANFEGYQKQVGKRTVQGVLEDVLKNVFKESVQVQASGRTDKGVHALCQTIHFDGTTKIPVYKLIMVMRQYLPDDIVVESIEEKPAIFHARYDVISKTYLYHLDFGKFDVTKRNYRWFVKNFDRDRFKVELFSIIGEFDFASFTKTTDKNTVRQILDVSFDENDTELKVWIKGTGFMRFMMRNLIMAAYLIATNQLDYSMKDLIEQKDNTILKLKAEAGGLYLVNVSYE